MGQAEDKEKVVDGDSDYTPSIAPAADQAEAGDFDVNVPDEFVDGVHEEFEEKTERAGLPRG